MRNNVKMDKPTTVNSGDPPNKQSLILPCVLSKTRTEHGKQIRKLYKNDIGIPFSESKGFRARLDRISNTITSFTTDNYIMELAPIHKDRPTNEDLVEYFKDRIRIRKMTPRTALRLMDVDDADIDKLMDAEICKTALYKLAGNSIVVGCLYHIFYKMFINTKETERNLFNYE